LITCLPSHLSNQVIHRSWLARNIYDEFEEVQLVVTRWLGIYNNEQPNIAIGIITSKQKLNNMD